MQVVSRDSAEMLIVNFNITFSPIISKPPIPVNLSGYEFVLVLTATQNILINNTAERLELVSSAPNSVFQVQADAGRIFISFPMTMLRSEFYNARLYIRNNNISLLLYEFQIAKNVLGYG